MFGSKKSTDEYVLKRTNIRMLQHLFMPYCRGKPEGKNPVNHVVTKYTC